MKSRKVEIMGKVFAAASIAAMAPTAMAMHQDNTKAAIHQADGTVAATQSLDCDLTSLCSDDGVSWS
jgi:hypothetical protein